MISNIAFIIRDQIVKFINGIYVYELNILAISFMYYECEGLKYNANLFKRLNYISFACIFVYTPLFHIK